MDFGSARRRARPGRPACPRTTDWRRSSLQAPLLRFRAPFSTSKRRRSLVCRLAPTSDRGVACRVLRPHRFDGLDVFAIRSCSGFPQRRSWGCIPALQGFPIREGSSVAGVAFPSWPCFPTLPPQSLARMSVTGPSGVCSSNRPCPPALGFPCAGGRLLHGLFLLGPRSRTSSTPRDVRWTVSWPRHVFRTGKERRGWVRRPSPR